MECRFCKNNSGNNYLLEEFMFKSGKQFEYFECNNCKGLQICEIPSNIEDFYPINYYSFSYDKENDDLKKNIFNFLFRFCIKQRLKQKTILGFLIAPFFVRSYPWLGEEMKSFNSKVLDIGTGHGSLLLRLKKLGFNNLHGIDPFINEDIHINDISILKKTIDLVNDTFDIIMMHHVIEHVVDPFKELREVASKLKNDGKIIITTPIHNNWAWKKYGKYWVQLDVPRHLNIFSQRAMFILSNSVGLEVEKMIYISNAFQFTGSEKYLKNLSLDDVSDIKIDNKKTYNKKAQELNDLNDGDTACFVLRRKLV